MTEQHDIPRHHRIPIREQFAPMLSNTIDLPLPESPEELQAFRNAEFDDIANQILNLPTYSFEEARERELIRTTQYYETFATVFGVDMRNVARTRSQMNGTTMCTSPIIMQAIFDDEGNVGAQEFDFFESKLKFKGFEISARSVTIIDGIPFSFSVMKRKVTDDNGEYEIDYPVISMSRETLRSLKQWHDTDVNLQKLPFVQNPIIESVSDAFSKRIHDWVHQAFLYDTGASTEVFDRWSKNSFFVEHFFKDPLMINYEFMSDKIHFLVWQQLLKEHDELTILMTDTKKLYTHLDSFEQWLMTAHTDKFNQNKKITNMVGFIGTRGLFNLVPFDILQEQLGELPRYTSARALLPEKYEPYLKKLHEPLDELKIPFRAGSNVSISLEQIFEEYIVAIMAEARFNKVKSAFSARLQMPDNSYNEYLNSLPRNVSDQLQQYVDLTEFHPHILELFQKMYKELAEKVHKNIYEAILSSIELDSDGYFYFSLNQNEIDLHVTDSSAEVPYQKSALLIQVPWDFIGDFPVVLTRSKNVLAQQKGAETTVKAGDIILINIENDRLAYELHTELDGMNTTGQFKKIWSRIESERNRGHVALGDAYPYELSKAREVFDIQLVEDISGQSNQIRLNSGYYNTRTAKRRVAKLPGPVSINAGDASNVRRRVLFGGLAQNHAPSSERDIFPIDATSFDKFYAVDRLLLPNFSVSTAFTNKYQMTSITQANEILHTVLRYLEQMNSIRIHGMRGKPSIVRLDMILSKINNEFAQVS